MRRRLQRRQHGRCDPPGARPWPGHTIVTMLCDAGTRYQAALFSPAFLHEQGIPVPAWLALAFAE